MCSVALACCKRGRLATSLHPELVRFVPLPSFAREKLGRFSSMRAAAGELGPGLLEPPQLQWTLLSVAHKAQGGAAPWPAPSATVVWDMPWTTARQLPGKP